ncbi:MAG: polysaccharide deacetylase family protein [Muribaculaceae bacterium]|nr:polysaccharide deacetylase family protein [Muribaculaceae bacterium]
MRKVLSIIAGIMLATVLLSITTSQCKDDIWEYDEFGAAVCHRFPHQKTVHLLFTADSAFEGGAYAMDVMSERGVKGSFFFTGNFMRDSLRNGAIIRRAIADGHYVGPHGDRHILLAEWNKERTTLASPDSALTDMEHAYELLARYGICRDSATILIPSFEWYNSGHVNAFRNAGLFTINMTPGIETYRDYTTPDLDYYTPSEFMWNQLLSREQSHGLDGAIILIHLGTDSTRTDKFYNYLPAILDTLTARGYRMERF